jgi:hypothetical protein
MSSARLSVRSIELYNNGFAVFHRAALARGPGSLELHARSDELESILGSLIVQDAHHAPWNVSFESSRGKASGGGDNGGGGVGTGHIALAETDATAGLLRQLRGCTVRLRYFSRHPTASKLESLRSAESDAKEPTTVLIARIVGLDAASPESNIGSIGGGRSNSGSMGPSVCVCAVDTGEVLAVPLRDLVSFAPTDPGVAADIAHAMTAIRLAMKTDSQGITLFHGGDDAQGERTIDVRYATTATPWESSYRITLDAEPSPDPLGAEGDTVSSLGSFALTLEGFALVRNECADEDWTGVHVTLVTGAPGMNAGGPAPRGFFSGMRMMGGGSKTSAAAGAADAGRDAGTVTLNVRLPSGSTVRTESSLQGNVHSLRAQIAAENSLSVASTRLVFAGKGMEDGRQLADYGLQPGSQIVVLARAGIQPGADGAVSAGGLATRGERIFPLPEPGSLSRYDVPCPVSVTRNQSAFVPFLREEMRAQKVRLFDASMRKGNPMSALMLINRTGRHVQAGPATVIDRESRFLGELSLPELAPCDERIVPFAVDLKIVITIDFDISALKFHRATIEAGSGTLCLHRRRRQRTIYTIANAGDRDVDLFLRHRFLDGWSLGSTSPPPPSSSSSSSSSASSTTTTTSSRDDVAQTPAVGGGADDTSSPVDIDDRHYTYRLPIAAMCESATHEVTEETSEVERFQLAHADAATIDEWAAKGYLGPEPPSAALVTLRTTAQTTREITMLSRRLTEAEAGMRDADEQQARLRLNIETLGSREAGRYIKALAEEERRHADLKTEAANTRVELSRVTLSKQRAIESIEGAWDITSQ